MWAANGQIGHLLPTCWYLAPSNLVLALELGVVSAGSGTDWQWAGSVPPVVVITF